MNTLKLVEIAQENGWDAEVCKSVCVQNGKIVDCDSVKIENADGRYMLDVTKHDTIDSFLSRAERCIDMCDRNIRWFLDLLVATA